MLLKVWLFLFSIPGQITSWISKSYDDGTIWSYLAWIALVIIVFLLRHASYNLNRIRERFNNIDEEEFRKTKTIGKLTDSDLSTADEILQKLDKLDITVKEIIPKIGNINTV